MTRQLLIQKTIDNLSRLPEQKLQEVSDFTEFLLSKVEDSMLTEGIQQLASNAKSLHFLEDEEDLYTADDLKEKYK